jgi:hypothetical protein
MQFMPSPLLVRLLLAAALFAFAQIAPAQNAENRASINDTACFLAGLPVSAGSPLEPLTRDPAWQQHANFFNQAWSKLDARQLQGIRAWQAEYLPEATAPMPVAYYMFSGPDLLYAEQFFPNASVYILAGTEPIGPLPDVLRLGAGALDPVLRNLETALNGVLSFSFFITKDMKIDLQHQELKGTLPIFYVFLARAGKTITDVSFITLDKSGIPDLSLLSARSKAYTPGVRITFTSREGGPKQTMFYFTTDLSNDGIKSQPGFMKFCETYDIGGSFLKSSSYLMFVDGFSTVRSFLLNHSKVIVQDDSGIPVSFLNPEKWQLRFFGNYIGPIDLFKQNFQPQLQALYSQSNPPPIDFGFGYRFSRKETTLMFAVHK